MKKLLLLLWGMYGLTPVSMAQHTVSYTESSDIFANPERGLQKYSITNSNYNTTAGYSNVNTATLTGWRSGSDQVTVIFRYFLLDAFLSADISTTYLDNMQLDFNRIRDAGLKCIVRFSYSDAQGSSAQQPVKSQILRHLEQVAPVLEANKDVIFSHQAGLIGTWGEWYYTNSSEFGTDGNINSTQWQNRKDVVDAMLNATPQGIPVQLRYPAAKQAMYGSTALTAATAYQNTPQARIGFFNDAFLNNWGDMGTFSVDSEDQNPVGTADYNYLSNETKYVPMTGETNGLNAPRTNGANALYELDLANWTTLNRDYYEQNFTNWISSGHYDDMLRGLGYRYVLQSTTFQLSGTSLNVSIDLENTGYARLFKSRKVYLVLRHSTTDEEQAYLVDTDPRTWEGTVTLSQTFDLGALPAGEYEAFLSLPDADEDLALRPEYSIRMANTGVWEAATGCNDLSQTVSKIVLSNEEGEASENWLSIYPNPAPSAVYVHSSAVPPEQVVLINSTGQVVRRLQPHAASAVIDVQDLPAGFYLVNVLMKDGGVFNKTLEVRR